MYALLRQLLFLLPPHASHSAAMTALGLVEHAPSLAHAMRRALGPHDSRLVTRAMGLEFPTPLGLAGGFDKNGHRVRALASLGFGFVEIGTVTAEAQAENPRPNLFRLPADHALINRLGFPNDGARTVASRVARARDRGGINVPIAMSIGKTRSVELEPLSGVIEDYLVSFRAVRPASDFVIVNISSPNTSGLRKLQSAELSRELLGALVSERARTGGACPILLKLAPDLLNDDAEALLDVVKDVGLDGVVATNTTIARTGLLTPDDVWRKIGAGGLSGPPLRPRALELVRLARRRLGTNATIIGVGGIETARHAHDMLGAGANLIQIYTSLIYGGPLLPMRIARGLVRTNTANAGDFDEAPENARERGSVPASLSSL